MKISEVIQKLEELKAKHGDVLVETRHQESNGQYAYSVYAEVDSVEFDKGSVKRSECVVIS